MMTRRVLRDERGELPAFMVLFPLCLTILFGLVQAGLYYQGAVVAQSAAQAGLEAARVSEAGEAEGWSAAQQVISQHPGSLQGATVQINGGGDEFTVTVRGSTDSIAGDWVPTEVEKSVSGPIERVRP